MKKIISIIVMLVVLIMISYVQVQAGMADFTDKEADETANKQLQEQQNELAGFENKSTNNFLKSLNIKGYKIDFDKQTINYDIGETNDTTIEITAEAEDEKAKINGSGTISLQAGENDIRVDVVAESGTTRTYHIKVVCTAKNASRKIENTENIIETNTENINNNIESNQNQGSSEKAVLIACAIVIFVAIIIIVMKRK